MANIPSKLSDEQKQNLIDKVAQAPQIDGARVENGEVHIMNRKVHTYEDDHFEPAIRMRGEQNQTSSKWASGVLIEGASPTDLEALKQAFGDRVLSADVGREHYHAPYVQGERDDFDRNPTSVHQAVFIANDIKEDLSAAHETSSLKSKLMGGLFVAGAAVAFAGGALATGGALGVLGATSVPFIAAHATAIGAGALFGGLTASTTAIVSNQSSNYAPSGLKLQESNATELKEALSQSLGVAPTPPDALNISGKLAQKRAMAQSQTPSVTSSPRPQL